MYVSFGEFEFGAYKVMERTEVHSQTHLQPADPRDQVNRYTQKVKHQGA